MTEAEIKAAAHVIAVYDMRNCTTLEKCEDLARKVLEAVEKSRKEGK